MSTEKQPAALVLIVKWEQYPFAIPYAAEQEKDNLIWAQNETRRILLETISNHPEIQVLRGYKDKIRLLIPCPESTTAQGSALWMEIFTVLKGQDKLSSISVYVNNRFSESIARALADTVQTPWRTGFKGPRTHTVIYHK